MVQKKDGIFIISITSRQFLPIFQKTLLQGLQLANSFAGVKITKKLYVDRKSYDIYPGSQKLVSYE